MSDYYDRQGRPLTLQQWGAMLEERQQHKRVAETLLEDGTWISTVWLGLNHNFGSGPPLIFETMVFPSKDNLSELAMDRYSTEADARAGHDAMVEAYRRGDIPSDRATREDTNPR